MTDQHPGLLVKWLEKQRTPPPNKIMFDPIFLNFAQSLSLQDIQNQFETLLNTCTELFTLSSIHSAGA